MLRVSRMNPVYQTAEGLSWLYLLLGVFSMALMSRFVILLIKSEIRDLPEQSA